MMAQGTTLGWGDELAAALEAPIQMYRKGSILPIRAICARAIATPRPSKTSLSKMPAGARAGSVRRQSCRRSRIRWRSRGTGYQAHAADLHLWEKHHSGGGLGGLAGAGEARASRIFRKKPKWAPCSAPASAPQLR